MTIVYFSILGLLISLLYPPYFFLPLGFILFPLIDIVYEKKLVTSSNKHKFLSGFSLYLFFLFSYLQWIYQPFLVFEETKNFFFLSFLLIIVIGILFGIVFIFIKNINNIFINIFYLPILFSFFEFILSRIPSGFPWVSISAIISSNQIGIYLIKIFGTQFTSFLIILIFMSPYLFIKYEKNLNYNLKVKLILIPTILISLISFLVLTIKNSENKDRQLVIDIFQIEKSNKQYDEAYLTSVYEDIVKKIIDSDADLIIFAENNYPYLIKDIKDLGIQKYLNPNQTVIIGGTRVHNSKYFNSLLSINSNNAEYFDKKILVPFGEFLPFRKQLNFMEIISGTQDYSIGQQPRLININNEFSFIPVICYEILFYWKILNIKNKNSDLIINITNDIWFGKYLGPYQHFYISKLRAAEFNKPLIRVSNNGISSIIDNNGKILKFIKLNNKAKLSYKMKIKKYSDFNIIHKIFTIIYMIFVTYYIFIIYFKKNEIR